MNNKQLVSLFFGLGFLVLVAGIFATTNMTPNRNNNGVEPQTINRTTNNNGGNIGNAINENMPTTNEMADKIKTELSKNDLLLSDDKVASWIKKNAKVSEVEVSLLNKDEIKEVNKAMIYLLQQKKVGTKQ